jgi:hypothetical protein
VSDGYIGDVSARVPDLIEAVVGVRGFRRSGHLLASPFQCDEWHVPEAHAVCAPKRRPTAAALVRLGQKPKSAASTAARIVGRQRRLPPHAAPHADCSCGIYGYHDPNDKHLTEPIVGIVQAWGLLQVHPRGFRAEHVRVVALALSDPEPGVAGERFVEVARRASAWWKVPLLTRSEVVASMSEFGSPVPIELRPQEEKEESA